MLMAASLRFTQQRTQCLAAEGGDGVTGDPEFGHREGEKPQNIAVVLSEDGKRWAVAVSGSVPADWQVYVHKS